MSTPEWRLPNPEDKRQEIMKNFLELLDQALRQAEELKLSSDPEAEAKLESMVIRLRHDSFQAILPAKLHVMLPDGAYAESSPGEKQVLETNIKDFITTDLREIDVDRTRERVDYDTVKVVFRDEAKTYLWMTVWDSRMDIEPIFPDSEL